MLTDATELDCPYPSGLPVRLDAYDFEHGDSEELEADFTRSADEASETFGNPDGLIAHTFLAKADDPAEGDVHYQGRKARTADDSGLLPEPFSQEFVSLWFYDTGKEEWQGLGRTETDDDGFYNFDDTDFVAPNGEPVYSILEGDGSCAVHTNYLLPAGTKIIVTDIDGTLTTGDAESFKEIGDASYVPKMKVGADVLMQTWAEKGYTIVYVTARPHLLRAMTEAWLKEQGFPKGLLITSFDLNDPATDKARWLDRLMGDFGWVIQAAYGNADTDIEAYADAEIPKEITFIIGEFAGDDDTVAIEDDDYTSHIADYVTAQPDND